MVLGGVGLGVQCSLGGNLERPVWRGWRVEYYLAVARYMINKRQITFKVVDRRKVSSMLYLEWKASELKLWTWDRYSAFSLKVEKREVWLRPAEWLKLNFASCVVHILCFTLNMVILQQKRSIHRTNEDEANNNKVLFSINTYIYLPHAIWYSVVTVRPVREMWNFHVSVSAACECNSLTCSRCSFARLMWLLGEAPSVLFPCGLMCSIYTNGSLKWLLKLEMSRPRTPTKYWTVTNVVKAQY